MKHIQYHLHHTASREPLPQHLQQLATHFDLTQCPICAWYFTTTKQCISRKHNPCIPFGKGSTGKEEVDDDQPATTIKQLTYHSPSHSTHSIQHPQTHFPLFGLTLHTLPTTHGGHPNSCVQQLHQSRPQHRSHHRSRFQLHQQHLRRHLT